MLSPMLGVSTVATGMSRRALLLYDLIEDKQFIDDAADDDGIDERSMDEEATVRAGAAEAEEEAAARDAIARVRRKLRTNMIDDLLFY
jgi:hypothetical protein